MSTAPNTQGPVGTISEDAEFENADTAVVQAIMKAEIDQQITTARAFPRSIAKFHREAREMVTLNEDVAKECVYSLPRDGKTIEGPSSRLAEIIASAWGNCRATARVIAEERDFIVAQGVFHDLERNVQIGFEVRRRISGRNGKRYSADMISTTGNAACSIALRNAVFKGIPKAFWAPAFEDAKRIILGDPRTVETRRKSAIEHLGKQGVSLERVLSTLSLAGAEDIGLDELAKLHGILTAVKEGDTTLAEAFGIAEKPAGPTTKGAAGLKDALAGTPPIEPNTPPPAGAVAMDRRTNTRTDATSSPTAAESTTQDAGGMDAPDTDVAVGVVTPLNDIERATLRKEVAQALGRRGFDAAQAARYLTDEAGREIDSAASLSDAELQRVKRSLDENEPA